MNTYGALRGYSSECWRILDLCLCVCLVWHLARTVATHPSLPMEPIASSAVRSPNHSLGRGRSPTVRNLERELRVLGNMRIGLNLEQVFEKPMLEV